MQIALKPRDDIDALTARFAKDGRVRIDGLFREDVARAIYNDLRTATPWHLVHSGENGDGVKYTPKQWNALPQSEQQARLRALMQRARTGFAYLYSFFPMIESYIAGSHPHWPLHALTEYLNHPDMQTLVRTVSGAHDVIKMDGHATLYTPGHFLNAHTDHSETHDRRVAYVMGFTLDWRLDWGGQLLFNDGGRIIDGFSPSFNTLTLFRVPQPHIVTPVTSFAGAGRYSVTGWMLAS